MPIHLQAKSHDELEELEELVEREERQLLSKFSSNNNKPNLIKVAKYQFPSWVSLFGWTLFLVFVGFQLSAFYDFFQIRKDEYYQAHAFAASDDFKVCSKWAILSGICKDIRIITSQHFIVPAFKDFIQSKFVYTLFAFDSLYAQIGGTIFIGVIVWMFVAHYFHNERLENQGKTIAKQLFRKMQ